jgi:hypothetical protein
MKSKCSTNFNYILYGRQAYFPLSSYVRVIKMNNVLSFFPLLGIQIFLLNTVLRAQTSARYYFTVFYAESSWSGPSSSVCLKCKPIF